MNPYETKDQYTAAILRCNAEYNEKEEFSVEWLGRKARIWYLFSDAEQCKAIIAKHLEGELLLNSKDFVEALEWVREVYKTNS